VITPELEFYRRRIKLNINGQPLLQLLQLTFVHWVIAIKYFPNPLLQPISTAKHCVMPL
jgi:hypothetical protein